MTCYLAQKDDVHLGVKKVGRALAEVCLQHYSQRKTNTAKLPNPIPYCADYFGHKLYMDQNETLMVYGVTHVLAIAGHSHSIAAFSTMPIKNNAKCYMRFIGMFFIVWNSRRFLRKAVPYSCFKKNRDLIKIVIKFSCKSKRKPWGRK